MTSKKTKGGARPATLRIAQLYAEHRTISEDEAIQAILDAGTMVVALTMVEEGLTSASRIAELLDVSVNEVFDKAEEMGVRLGATEDQFRASLVQLKESDSASTPK